MKEFWSNRLFRFGAIIAQIGWTPLPAIIFLAMPGLWPDPNPNPIGPGVLFFVSFWPAVICLGPGAVQMWRRRRQAGTAAASEYTMDACAQARPLAAPADAGRADLAFAQLRGSRRVADAWRSSRHRMRKPTILGKTGVGPNPRRRQGPGRGQPGHRTR